MSQIIRPEAQAFLTRWREVIVGIGLGALGLWWGLTSLGLVMAFGWVLVALAAMLIWSALQRMRFATSGEDPGVVDILEGQISYFSAQSGGFASITELVEIRILQEGPRRSWVLISQGWPDLVIPVGAAGADKLFDAFAALPGLTGGMLVAALQAEGGTPAGPGLPTGVVYLPRYRTIWTRPVARVLH